MFARTGIGAAILLLAVALPAVAAEVTPVVRAERARVLEKPPWTAPTSRPNVYFSLRLTISPKGEVSKVELVDRGYASRDVIDSAIENVRRYRFAPATRDGVPVESRVRQSFNHGNGDASISREFQRQSRKVAELIEAGDFAGGNFHAEWMLSEVVRNKNEYLSLKGILAQTNARAGNLHEALAAVRYPTARTKPAPPLSLGQEVPANGPDNYLVPDRDFISELLGLRMRLAFEQGIWLEAIRAYYELAGLRKLKPDDPLVRAAGALRTTLEGDAPLVAKGRIIESGSWQHDLFRRGFTLNRVEGSIEEIDLFCGDQFRVLVFAAGVDWTVPSGWEGCSLSIRGGVGSTFEIVEFEEKREPTPQS